MDSVVCLAHGTRACELRICRRSPCSATTMFIIALLAVATWHGLEEGQVSLYNELSSL